MTSTAKQDAEALVARIVQLWDSLKAAESAAKAGGITEIEEAKARKHALLSTLETEVEIWKTWHPRG